MKISKVNFGLTTDGIEAHLYCIENNNGASISLINYGAAIQAINVPDKHGNITDVLLGYDTINEYQEYGEYFFGATIGRVANRIEDSSFDLNGKTYILPVNNGRRNSLHGGIRGFDKCIWDAETVESGVKFSRLSKNGEEGYPGNLTVSVSYQFTDDNEIIIDYDAVADADTIVNMTNHSYFNLSGHSKGNIGNHTLIINADKFLESNNECLATGNYIDVEGTPFDFRNVRKIGDVINAGHIQQEYVGGFDHSFVLRDCSKVMKEAAIAKSPDSGIIMKVSTNKPAIHLYSGNFMKPMPGKEGTRYNYREGFCLETQYYPNSMKQKHFPSIILKKGEKYRFRTIYAFSTEDK